MAASRNAANHFEELLERATAENSASEDWALIIGICDQVNENLQDGPTQCLEAISKRLTNSRNSNALTLTLSVLSACVSNCGITFRREVASKSFLNRFSRFATDYSLPQAPRDRALSLIEEWVAEYRNDRTLHFFNETYAALRQQGVSFPSKKRQSETSRSALNSKAATDSSFVPTVQANSPRPEATDATFKTWKGRALYDFISQEAGELSFHKGDQVKILGALNHEWLIGEFNGVKGIFPVNFVEPLIESNLGQMMTEFDWTRIEELNAQLRNFRGKITDDEALMALYNECNVMRPKLLKIIEELRARKEELLGLNTKFIQARAAYDQILTQAVPMDATSAMYGSGPFQTWQLPQGQPYRYPGFNPAYGPPPAQTQGGYPPPGMYEQPSSNAYFAPQPGLYPPYGRQQ